jgi:uncharacterized protein DUF6615
MPDLCETFRKEAGVVWNRMKNAARLGISLSEETITECALYGIAAAHQHKGIIIDLATKPAESKHGADWEWWLVRNGKGIPFRVQAKRLYPDGKYRALKKPGKDPYQQLDKLVSNSHQVGAYPLYCFYNFQHPKFVVTSASPCKHTYHAPSYWGCALAFPEKVKSTGSDELRTLKPPLYPWHLLVCGTAKTYLPSAAARFISETRGDGEPELRKIPDRVARLIEFGDNNRESTSRDQLGPSFWQAGEEPSEEIAGLVVFRDVRD